MEKRISALKFLTACAWALIALSAATVAFATASIGEKQESGKRYEPKTEIVNVEVIEQYDAVFAPSMREQPGLVTEEFLEMEQAEAHDTDGVEETTAESTGVDYSAMTLDELLLAPDGTDEYYRDLWMLACVMYKEAGGDACSDTARIGVGTVVMNRVAHESFPDTIEGVLTQPGQYNTFSWEGIVWPYRAGTDVESHAVYRAFACAERVLNGERAFDETVIWQSGVPQGTETVLHLDGIYFCR